MILVFEVHPSTVDKKKKKKKNIRGTPLSRWREKSSLLPLIVSKIERIKNLINFQLKWLQVRNSPNVKTLKNYQSLLQVK